MRLVLVRLRKRLMQIKEKDGLPWLISSVHDEINVSVPKDRVVEFLPLLLECMDIRVQGWLVPMDVGVEVGWSWGCLFKFKFADGRLIPEWEA